MEDSAWITIACAPKYEVSSTGWVRLKRTGRILKPFLDKKQEYPRVDLYLENGKRRRMMVHVLVADAILGARPEGYEIDHVNCDRSDNRVSNLRYVTPQENRANPNTVRNVAISRVKRLVARGHISEEEGRERIKLLMAS